MVAVQQEDGKVAEFGEFRLANDRNLTNLRYNNAIVRRGPTIRLATANEIGRLFVARREWTRGFTVPRLPSPETYHDENSSPNKCVSAGTDVFESLCSKRHTSAAHFSGFQRSDDGCRP